MRSFTAAAALVLATAALPASAEDYVVIESTLPAFAQGAVLTSDKPVDLAASDRLVLVDGSGRMVTLAGPFHGVPPAGGGDKTGSGEALKSLATLFGRNDQRNEVGVARAVPWRGEAIRTAADALAIDATSGGDMCVFDAGRAEIVHDPKGAGEMTVQSMGGGAEATITWQRMTLAQPWPARVPLTDGDLISFVPAAGEQTALATIHLLRADAAASDVARAVQMAEAGCSEQARSLLAVAAKSAK
jgi:hypothetical protein